MKLYQSQVMFHEQEVKNNEFLTEEKIYRDLIHKMIEDIPIDDLKKLFTFEETAFDAFPNIKYKFKVNILI